jgi:hypothetical protein
MVDRVNPGSSAGPPATISGSPARSVRQWSAFSRASWPVATAAAACIRQITSRTNRCVSRAAPKNGEIPFAIRSYVRVQRQRDRVLAIQPDRDLAIRAYLERESVPLRGVDRIWRHRRESHQDPERNGVENRSGRCKDVHVPDCGNAVARHATDASDPRMDVRGVGPRPTRSLPAADRPSRARS